jgi:hypothetical protein
VAELILHPDHPSLGAKHDQVEANAFAKVAVAASPGCCPDQILRSRGGGVDPSKYRYCSRVGRGAIERGILTGDQIDVIIAREVAVKALANERARRAAWKIVENNAAGFAAHGLED